MESEGAELPFQLSHRERDAAAYDRIYPESWARSGPVGALRHLPVVSIQLFPYRWDPAIRGLRVATELEVTVRFLPEVGRKSDLKTPFDDPTRSRASQLGEALPPVDRQLGAGRELSTLLVSLAGSRSAPAVRRGAGVSAGGQYHRGLPGHLLGSEGGGVGPGGRDRQPGLGGAVLRGG